MHKHTCMDHIYTSHTYFHGHTLKNKDIQPPHSPTLPPRTPHPPSPTLLTAVAIQKTFSFCSLSLALLKLTFVSPCLHPCLHAHSVDSWLIYPFVLVVRLTVCDNTSHKWQFQARVLSFDNGCAKELISLSWRLS